MSSIINTANETTTVTGEKPGRGLRHFQEPDRSLRGIGTTDTAKALEAASDVALVIDSKGVICDIAFGSEDLSGEGYASWLNRPWIDTVTVESRGKIESLLAQALADQPPRWRQVNHPSPSGSADVPIVYSAVRVGSTGRVIAVGRDLRNVAALQQRLVDAQQALERDYWRLRHAETRYRLLFEMASEAILILDAATLKVAEANPAAAAVIGEPSRRLVGRVFPHGFDEDSTQSLESMLATVRAAGKADGVAARLVTGTSSYLVSASMFRQDSSTQILVRLTPQGLGGDRSPAAEVRSRVLEVVENSPDGLVVTDPDGKIVSANRAFIELAQLANEEQARGETLDRWFGRPGVDMSVLSANLKRHGSVRLFATTLRGEFGATAEVEISAVSVLEAETPCMGFVIRNVGQRVSGEVRGGRELPRSVEQLTELVGRVSMKELVREATDVIERLCIQAALEVTGDNRASAAEMLGLSRQSLYVKLRRYGLGDHNSNDSN